MIKIPKKIMIRGKKWKVSTRKKVKDDDGTPCSGLTDPSKSMIYIRSELTDRQKVWTFFHEFTHAVLYEAGVTINTGGLSDIVEEIICDNVADGFIELLKIGKKKK